MAEAFVETKRLSKIYGRVRALEECSLQINAGEVFGLLGPNGSGKTTLIRLLLGFLRPTSGTARVGGLDCYADSVAVHRLLTYMPGEARLFPHMRGRDVLNFFSDIHPLGDIARSLKIADRLGLDTSRRVLFCSSGMRQKIALAAILGPRAPLVIMDEPTSNLDPTARKEVLTLVAEAKSEGRTILFSSHILSEVEQGCDRTCILRYGKLVHEQAIHDLRRQHRILAKLHGPTPSIPNGLKANLSIEHSADGVLTILTPGELSPVLGWLASLPLEEVRVEPIGLQAVYDLFHAPEAA